MSSFGSANRNYTTGEPREQEKSVMSVRLCSHGMLASILITAVLNGGSALAASTSSTDTWTSLGGDPGSHQYSALSQINTQTIHSLGLLWYSDLPIPEGLIGNPLVKDGVVYQSGPWGRALATDLATGKTLWEFDPHLDLSSYSILSALLATVNRGLGMDDRNIYVNGGCSLFAVNRRTGTEVWRTPLCEPSNDLGANSSPRVGGGRVFVGIGNAQSGTNRGYAVAFDASTGKELWRFYTVPGDPTKPPENPQMAMAAKTWGDRYWVDTRGSGGVWEGMIYDPQTGLLIFGSGNPGVDGHEEEFSGKEMLFTDSLIAVNAATGQYVWHLHETTGDVFHPGDATAHLQLTDLQIAGQTRHVIMQAAKNGYFYVVDARTGQVLSADEYGIPNINWEPIDKESGTLTYRSAMDFWKLPPGAKVLMQPGGYGAHTWELCSYDPDTGLVYIPAFVAPSEWSRSGLDIYVGFSKDATYKNHGVLVAWDPIGKAERWQVDHPVTINGGVLSTAGGLVFQGTPGKLYAYEAKTGKTLWSYDTQSIILGAPSTVMMNGRQVILVPSGDGNSVVSSKSARLVSTSETLNAPSRLLAFALGGTATMPSRPPKMIPRPAVPRQPRELAHAGQIVFEKHGCGNCHGDQLVASGNGRIPDLRTVPEPVLRLMPQILRDGLFRSAGMPRFPDISDEQIVALQAYFTDAAWDAYAAQATSSNGAKPQSSAHSH
jgi:quinohemoprotein ethanol dehydrogenase